MLIRTDLFLAHNDICSTQSDFNWWLGMDILAGLSVWETMEILKRKSHGRKLRLVAKNSLKMHQIPSKLGLSVQRNTLVGKKDRKLERASITFHNTVKSFDEIAPQILRKSVHVIYRERDLYRKRTFPSLFVCCGVCIPSSQTLKPKWFVLTLALVCLLQMDECVTSVPLCVVLLLSCFQRKELWKRWFFLPLFISPSVSLTTFPCQNPGYSQPLHSSSTLFLTWLCLCV